MNGVITFGGFVVFLALAVWGRRLREESFRQLPVEQKIQVVDKMPNYSSVEIIPFAALLLGLLGLLLFRMQWLKVGFAAFVPLLVVLVAILHLKTRARFRALDLAPAFVTAYERSRIMTYSGLGVWVLMLGWVIYHSPF